MKKKIDSKYKSVGRSFFVATLIVFCVSISLTSYISSRSFLKEQMEKVMQRVENLSAKSDYYRGTLLSEVSRFHQQRKNMLYNPGSAMAYCREWVEYIDIPCCVCLEFAPGAFPDKPYFAPVYDGRTKTADDMAEHPETKYYYKKDSLFIEASSKTCSAFWTVVDNIFGTDQEYIRLCVPLYGENGKLYCLLNNLFSPDVYAELQQWIDSDVGKNDCQILIDEKGNYFKNTADSFFFSFDDDVNYLDSVRLLWGEDVYADVMKTINNDSIYHIVHEVEDYSAFLCISSRNEFFDVMIWKVEIDDSSFLRILGLEIASFLIALAALCIIGFLNGKKLSRLVRSEEKYKAEVDNAAMIQKSMLPSHPLDCPSVSLDAVLLPSATVGGDCYYYFEKDGLLYLCIGDVVGKGVSAALFMSKVVSLFHIVSLHHNADAHGIAESINRELCVENDDVMFVTLFIAILDLRTGKMNYCNAGHDGPVFWDGNADHGPCVLNVEHDIPLGVEPDAEFTEGTLQLVPGSLFCLYTDGVTEAKNSTLNMFGEEGLLRVFSDKRGLGPRQLNEAVVSAIRSFAGAHPQSDDITLLTLKSEPVDYTVVLDNKEQELVKLRPLFSYLRDYLYCTDKQLMDVRVAVDEAVTNCVHYAYGSGSGQISIHVASCAGSIVFTIKDEGVPFNILEYTPVSQENVDIEDMELGGLGIPLIKKTFDAIEYHRDGGSNILILKKTLNLL